MIQKIFSYSTSGLNAIKVEIEVALHNGIPKFSIVGLADTTVQESKERIKSAIKQSGFDFPRKKIAVNLAPADIQKTGPGFDVPVALNILCAQKILKTIPDHAVFFGELNLSGEIRPVKGLLPCLLGARRDGFVTAYIPKENLAEAQLVKNLQIYPIDHLSTLVHHLNGQHEKESFGFSFPDAQPVPSAYDFSHVKGQIQAKRALVIAASGGHNVLFRGSPGCGKTLLAKCFSSIFPPLTYQECLEVTQIHSLVGSLGANDYVVRQRPFRSPHHTASHVSLVGGGRIPRPGEISLAHRGVLFLDEIAEFPLQTLESLRQPLEDGDVCITRVGGSYSFPAEFILVGTMNPCPCGYAFDTQKECICSSYQIERYQKKLSGPILDRIDIQLDVPKVSIKDLQNLSGGQSSDELLLQVQSARNIQAQRYQGSNYRLNCDVSSSDVHIFVNPSKEALDILRQAADRFGLSARAYFRMLKIARTIADLEEVGTTNASHIREALQYRIRDFN